MGFICSKLCCYSAQKQLVLGCSSFEITVCSHPLQVLSGASVQIFQAASASDGRTHLVNRYPVKATIAQALEEGRIIDKPSPERHGANPIGRLALVVDQGWLITETRHLDVIGIG